MPKVCYYCGKLLKKDFRSKEHIPPKMMFDAFEGDAITVFSCEQHNDSKSGQDQAIISGFMQSLDEMLRSGKGKFTPNVRKAIKHKSKNTFQSTKNTVERRELAVGLPDLALIKYPIIDWIRQITAGLVFDATETFDSSINWDKTIVHTHSFYPEEFQNLSNIELAERAKEINRITARNWEWQIRWENGWSPYPSDIYRFFVSFDDDTTVCFKHRFYDSFTWYVQFECLPSTRQKIIKRVRN